MIIFILSGVIGIGAFLFYFPPAIVIGDSMFPTYHDGQIIFSTRFFKEVELGEVYIFKRPNENKYVIKRCSPFISMHGIEVERLKNEDSGEYSYYFLGDNADFSTDSRDYGFVPRKNIIAKVISKGVRTCQK